MQLYSYKLTHDTGFAPNPFGAMLTLATCKPMIRRSKQVGQWLAGFTSACLTGDKVGEERLVYLMRIGEKLHVRDYFIDPRFQDKVPDMRQRGPLPKTGDNIYRPLVVGASEPSHFVQIPNPNHWGVGDPCSFHQERDISGQYVLVADEFYYFGVGAQAIPAEFRPYVPRGQSAHGKLTPPVLAERFITFMRQHYSPGRHGNPTEWKNEAENNLEKDSCA